MGGVTTLVNRMAMLADLALGQQVKVGEHACPSLQATAPRVGWNWRWVRGPGTEPLWIRRGRCSRCLCSHVRSTRARSVA
jgi:hypothetical protein